ncbi:RNA polymerase sigma factor [Piscinibacter sp.]|jgi:RNA polymerase sigma-70 factor (ECF subfamily)|uniref:RNA polymerase sigma factor n=1 Tax=Piscinibacter sp. TaxID=1903157 RepID=UPI002F418BFC
MLGRRNDDSGSGESALHAAEQTESRLIERIVARELPAFDALYRAYHPRLTRFLDRVTRRPALVEEVLNDTMLVVWNRADSYNGHCKVSTWIFAIAYRKALKALQRLDEAVEDPDEEPAASADGGPEAQAGQRELRELLAEALDELSAAHRAVVDLTYFHGIGYREIAQIVDCPVDTVKTRMFHARRRLKALLADRLEGWL